MVFAANGATVIGGKVLGARFRYPERAAEAAAYLDWFRAHGCRPVHEPRLVNEGEGDIVFAGRADPGRARLPQRPGGGRASWRSCSACRWSACALVDPRFYHLDTALSVLDARYGRVLPGRVRRRRAGRRWLG